MDEEKRDPYHCDCGKAKISGELMCRPCASGEGFPMDESYKD